MALRSPTLYHSFWGAYPTVSLPTSTSVEVGDTAYDTTLGQLCVCTSIGPVVWTPIGGGGGGGISQLTGATNEELTSGVQAVVGGFVFDASLYTSRVFRGYWTLVQSPPDSPPGATISLWDRGAPGSPAAGVQIETLFDPTVNVPVSLDSAPFTTDPTTPGPGVMVAALRMYEIRAEWSGPANSLVVRWAGLEVS